MTAPIQPSNLMKLKEKTGVLTPAISSAGIIASHSNLLNSSLKSKGKTTTILPDTKSPIESLEDPMSNFTEQENDICDDGEEGDRGRQSIESDCSDETEYTSMTEIKERASTCTIVRSIC
jgi:hypothetical protein